MSLCWNWLQKEEGWKIASLWANGHDATFGQTIPRHGDIQKEGQWQKKCKDKENGKDKEKNKEIEKKKSKEKKNKKKNKGKDKDKDNGRVQYERGPYKWFRINTPQSCGAPKSSKARVPNSPL